MIGLTNKSKLDGIYGISKVSFLDLDAIFEFEDIFFSLKLVTGAVKFTTSRHGRSYRLAFEGFLGLIMGCLSISLPPVKFHLKSLYESTYYDFIGSHLNDTACHSSFVSFLW
ncbi:uncharacterized protein OCT59_026551 [Rhizophagus irregularis]|uniref:uncharacterized protein n=1 Tax=Rhizophagus irregularis TaxID=588596 RepID=UPI003320C51F|nr:hypothetical protein OCT59_026551 [Rhizophagus irregularis]